MDLLTVTRRDGLAFEIRLREHRLVTDLSVTEGGRDLGPSPVELLAASLGACLALMTQRYCNTIGCTKGDVSVSLTTELAAKPSRVAALIADVELPADFPPERLQVMERLMAQFPVPATLRLQPRLDVDFSAAIESAVLHRG